MELITPGPGHNGGDDASTRLSRLPRVGCRGRRRPPRVIVWKGACGCSSGWFSQDAGRWLTRPGGYSFTDAAALMITWEAVGGFFIVHLPPDLARMASSLNW